MVIWPTIIVSAILLIRFSRANHTIHIASACICPGEDHPGPANNKGRGAPEIDALEAEKDKEEAGQVASQSAQFAPFTHDYLYGNSSADQWTVYTPDSSRPNTYK